MPNENSTEIAGIVGDLPPGIVVTYGDISEKVYGDRGKGRAVGQAISGAEKRDQEFPWWRVVSKNMKPKNEVAIRRLKTEGVWISNGFVEPQHYQPQVLYGDPKVPDESAE